MSESSSSSVSGGIQVAEDAMTNKIPGPEATAEAPVAEAPPSGDVSEDAITGKIPEKQPPGRVAPRPASSGPQVVPPLPGRQSQAGIDARVREAVAQASAARRRVTLEVQKRVVGHDAVIELMLNALISRGHGLIVGVPGLAKTLLVSTLAEVLELSFSRIQFTPDLMPSDITGTDVLEEDQATGRRSFRFFQGPIFAHIVLADEINRTPPKTQAALLQAMQESQVTAAGRTYSLDPPFMVLATQNPIEQEGTYPLPEAQLDRFMFRIDVGYPSVDDERRIVAQETRRPAGSLSHVLPQSEIAAMQDLVLEIPTPEHVLEKAVALCRATRPDDETAPDFVGEYLSWGAGPRAARFLVLGAKARALLHGRFAPTSEDLRELARPVLRHRLLRNFHAEAEGVTVPEVLDRLLAKHLK